MYSESVKQPRRWGPLILFASLPTLICCALPILLVSLGFGSVVAAMYSEYFPFLQWFGAYSVLTFGLTAVILLGAGYTLFRSARSCPADPELAAACASARRWNQRFFWAAIGVWSIGAFTAFVLPYFV